MKYGFSTAKLLIDNSRLTVILASTLAVLGDLWSMALAPAYRGAAVPQYISVASTEIKDHKNSLQRRLNVHAIGVTVPALR